MKLYICPICGGKAGYLAKYVGYFTWHTINWCPECKYEIIPLATPQEIE